MGTGPAGSVFGEFLFFIEKSGVQDDGGRHVAKRGSDPWVSYPEVKVQVRDLVRVVGIVTPFAPQLQETCAEFRARGVSIRGNFVLSRNLRYKSRGSPCG